MRLEVERNRRIHATWTGRSRVDKLREALDFKREHSGFAPTTILIDGFDFDDGRRADELDGLREIAAERDAELWMSAVTHPRRRDATTAACRSRWPTSSGSIDVILSMAHDGKGVHVGLLQGPRQPEVSDLRLALDPTTMLLVRE